MAPLALDAQAMEVARTRAATQLSRPTLSHYDDSGQFAVLPLFAASGIGYQLVAENLVRLYAPESTAAELAEGALMNSPGHRANLLHPDFNLVAVGAAEDPAAGRIVFAQVFRRSP